MRSIILTGLILLTGCDGAKTYSGGMPENPVRVTVAAPVEIVQAPEVVATPPRQTESGMVSASVPISLHPVYPYPAPDDCDPSVQIPLPNGGFGACVPDSLHPIHPPVTIPTGG